MKNKINNLYDFLKLGFPKMSLKQGLAVWYLLRNAYLYAVGEEEDINGSFRYNGGEIAKVTGIGDYMTYYCSSPVKDIKDSPLKKEYSFSYNFTKVVAKKLLKSSHLNKIIIDRGYSYALVWDELEHPKLIKVGQIRERLKE